jgi:hypothetical protein
VGVDGYLLSVNRSEPRLLSPTAPETHSDRLLAGR